MLDSSPFCSQHDVDQKAIRTIWCAKKCFILSPPVSHAREQDPELHVPALQVSPSPAQVCSGVILQAQSSSPSKLLFITIRNMIKTGMVDKTQPVFTLSATGSSTGMLNLKTFWSRWDSQSTPQHFTSQHHLIQNQIPQQHNTLKLGDFGSCNSLYAGPPYTEYISTRWYRAPECLLTDGHYSHKMDLWSTGCVFYEILT